MGSQKKTTTKKKKKKKKRTKYIERWSSSHSLDVFLYFCTITHIDTTCRRAQRERLKDIFVFHDRSDDAFRTISACQRVFIIIAPRRTARAPSSFISHVFLVQS